MRMEQGNTKTYVCAVKKTLKNGTIKYYNAQKNYVLQRGEHTILTAEAIEDIKDKIRNGCKKSFLMEKYRVSRTTINKVLA